MPELPEVHALAADLDSRLAGRVIARIDVRAFSALKTYDPPIEELRGRTIGGVERRGKFVDLRVDGGLHLILHLARAGWIHWRDAAPRRGGRPGRSPVALRLELDDGSGFDASEHGSQKRLAVHLVRAPSAVDGIARLGPDPLAPDFSEAAFAAILALAGRRQIKGVLRDQSMIAGIGNAYSDEILHAARMSPFKPADMPADDVSRLYLALRATLHDAVARAAGLAASELKAEKKSNLRVHGRTGLPCPVCGDTVRQVRFADSTLQYCPTCQTGGTPLADRVLSRLLK